MPGDPAVLVDHHGGVPTAALHLPQQVVDGLAVGHEQRLAHDVVDGGGLGAGRVLVLQAGDVLEVDHPEHVVQPLAHHRNPGEARAQEQRHRRAQGGARLHRDQRRAWHHHLPGEGVAEFEDRVDHLPLVVLDDLALAGHVDQFAQLGLGGERPVTEPAAGSEHVAHHHEQPCQRPQHPGQCEHHRSCHQPDPVRVLAPQRAWPDPDGDERGSRHDADRDQRGLPPHRHHVRCSTAVTSTAAADSHATRRKAVTDSVCAGSAATRASCREPRRPWASSSAARPARPGPARPRPRRRLPPARPARRPARTAAGTPCSPAPAVGQVGQQQPALQAEHLLLLRPARRGRSRAGAGSRAWSAAAAPHGCCAPRSRA